MEYVFRARTREEWRRLQKRAASRRIAAKTTVGLYDRLTVLRQAKWADDRAKSLGMSRATLTKGCAQRRLSLRCGCGTNSVVVGCGQYQLCGACSKRYWRKHRRRIGDAMTAHLGAAYAKWGQVGGAARGLKRPGVYLITLTAPHSGDLELDRKKIGDAWRRLSLWASGNDVWGAHVAVWEATPGTKGDGHVHLHVAAVSTWVPYDGLRKAWSTALGCEAHVNVSAPQVGRGRTAAFDAAGYVAKYVSKGVQPTDMTGQKAGELLAATRNRRRLTTSRHFFRPLRKKFCRTCKQYHRVANLPSSVSHLGKLGRPTLTGPPQLTWVDN